MIKAITWSTEILWIRWKTVTFPPKGQTRLAEKP